MVDGQAELNDSATPGGQRREGNRQHKSGRAAPHSLKLVPAAAWALADHAVFAAANFGMHVLLARHLSVEGYGEFATSFAIALAAGVFSRALVAEPMLVFGGHCYRHRQRSYITLVVLQQLGVGVVGAAALGLGGAAMIYAGFPRLGYILAGASLFQCTFAALMLLRQVSYLIHRPWIGAAAGTSYLVLTLGGLALLTAMQGLTPVSSLTVASLSSMFAAIFALCLIQPDTRSLFNRRRIWAASCRHVRYGRWALAAATCRFIPVEGYVLLLPVTAGLAEAAGFRAVRNLIAPLMLISTALGSLLLPRLSEMRSRGGFGSTLRRFTLLGLSPMVATWMLLVCLPGPILHLAYGSNFSEYSGVLWLVGLVPLFALFQSMASTAVRAFERPDIELGCGMVALCISLPIGLGWTALEPVSRAILGMVVHFTLTALCLSMALRRFTKTSAWTFGYNAARS